MTSTHPYFMAARVHDHVADLQHDAAAARRQHEARVSARPVSRYRLRLSSILRAAWAALSRRVLAARPLPPGHPSRTS